MELHPGLWAIIPVKRFDLGKSRLAAVLDQHARATLNRSLFDHVFDTTVAALGAQRIVVATADAELSAQVRARGAHAVADSAADDLNAALGEGCRYALSHGAGAVLVLPSDLPHISATDIEMLAGALKEPPCCVIAPDQSEQATNALLLAPPDPDFFRFGANSFTAHLEAATARRMAIAIVRREGLAFDLDTPEDYRAFHDSQA